MTATGSHIDFGFAARSTTLQGKPLRIATSAYEIRRIEACLAPTLSRKISQYALTSKILAAG